MAQLILSGIKEDLNKCLIESSFTLSQILCDDWSFTQLILDTSILSWVEYYIDSCSEEEKYFLDIFTYHTFL